MHHHHHQQQQPSPLRVSKALVSTSPSASITSTASGKHHAAATATPPCNSRNNSNGSSSAVALGGGGSSAVETADQHGGSATSPAEEAVAAVAAGAGGSIFSSSNIHQHSFDRLPPLCASPLSAYRHHNTGTSANAVIGNGNMILAGTISANASSAHGAGGLMTSSPHSHVALINAVTPALGFSLANGSDGQPSLLAVDPDDDPHHSYHHGMHVAPSPHHHHLYHHHHHHHDYHHHAAAAAALLGGFTAGNGVGLVDCVNSEATNCADREDSTGFLTVASTSANSVVGNYCLSASGDSAAGLVQSITVPAATLSATNDSDEAGPANAVESRSMNIGGGDIGVLRANDRPASSSSAISMAARTAAAAAAAVVAATNHHHHIQQHPPTESPYHHHHHRPLPMDISAL
uniref:Uncharacterized protein n=1 Tax=Anopheles epiroticus TaxID=199890 RepID=A0A182PT11_9DIPT